MKDDLDDEKIIYSKKVDSNTGNVENPHKQKKEKDNISEKLDIIDQEYYQDEGTPEQRQPNSYSKNRVGLLFVIILIVAIVGAVLTINRKYIGEFFTNSSVDNTINDMIVGTISTQSGGEYSFERYKGDMLVTRGEVMRCIDQYGKVKWSTVIKMRNPVISVYGDYIAVADIGSVEYTVIKNGKAIINGKSTQNILDIKMCDKGSFILVTNEVYYKAKITIKDVDNLDIFTWLSGEGHYSDCSLSKNNQNLVVATLNAGNSLYSELTFFNIAEKDPTKKQVIENSIIIDAKYLPSGEIVVACDNKLRVYDNNYEEKSTYEYDGKKLQKINLDSNDYSVLVFEGDISSNSEVEIVTRAGKTSTINGINGQVPFIDINGSVIMLNHANSVEFYDIAGNNISKIKTETEVRNGKTFKNSSLAMVMNGGTLNIIEIK